MNNKDLADRLGLVGNGVNNQTPQRPIQAGEFRYLGASGSPDTVKITRVGKDRFWYRGFPYDDKVKEQQIETWIGLDLIARAEETMRKRLADFEARAKSTPSLNVFAADIRAVLVRGEYSERKDKNGS